MVAVVTVPHVTLGTECGHVLRDQGKVGEGGSGERSGGYDT